MSPPRRLARQDVLDTRTWPTSCSFIAHHYPYPCTELVSILIAPNHIEDPEPNSPPCAWIYVLVSQDFLYPILHLSCSLLGFSDRNPNYSLRDTRMHPRPICVSIWGNLPPLRHYHHCLLEHRRCRAQYASNMHPTLQHNRPVGLGSRQGDT